MSQRAWLYLWIIFILGITKIGLALAAPMPNSSQWLTLILLVGLAIGSQFLEAEAPGRHSYYPHFVFFSAGLLLLPPALFVPLIIIPHLVEWAKKRWEDSPRLRQWYIQPFNMATHLLAGAAAHWVHTLLAAFADLSSPPLSMVAVSIAVLTYVFSNHLLIGQALVLARGISWQESGVLEIESLLTDFIMMLLGYVLALLYEINVWLILPALSPLVLIFQALKVPQLTKEAQTDAKTGLLNAGHWKQLFSEELNRAQHLQHSLSVIMVDLDGLRSINNTYGHLAGDAILAGIAEILHRGVRQYDSVCRFGGEEFAVALPHAGIEQAWVVAERLRQAIEKASFAIPSRSTTLRATASFGIATFPEHGTTITQLIHQADVALYQAKATGKNRVISAADLAHITPTDESNAASPYKAAFATPTRPPQPEAIAAADET